MAKTFILRCTLMSGNASYEYVSRDSVAHQSFLEMSRIEKVNHRVNTL